MTTTKKYSLFWPETQSHDRMNTEQSYKHDLLDTTGNYSAYKLISKVCYLIGKWYIKTKWLYLSPHCQSQQFKNCLGIKPEQLLHVNDSLFMGLGLVS